MTLSARAVLRMRALLVFAGFLLFFLGASAHADGEGRHDDNDAPNGPAVAPPLPPNNIVACFGANTTDPLVSCPNGTTSVLQSVSFGLTAATQPTGGGGAGAGKLVFSAMSFTKKFDKSSPVLFSDAAAGHALQNVTVAFYDTAGKLTQRFVIRLVFVESINYSNAIAPGGEPVEQVGLRYGALLEAL